MSEQEQDEAHTVDEDTDVLHQQGSGLGPQIRGFKVRGVGCHTEASDEHTRRTLHNQNDVTDDDGNQTKRGNGDQQTT